MNFNFDVDPDELIVTVTFDDSIVMYTQFDEDGNVVKHNNYNKLHNDDLEVLIKDICKKMIKHTLS